MSFPHFLSDIRKYVSNPKLILDIGSRESDYAIKLKKEFPNSRVEAFEPSKSNYLSCVENIKNSGLDIGLNKLALSDFTGQATFYFTPANIGCSSLNFPSFVPHTNDNTVIEEIVDVDILDNWSAKNGFADVWKVDVQGGEGSLIKGAQESLHHVKLIYMEVADKVYYEGGHHRSEVIAELEKFGFKIIRDISEWSHESVITLIKS